MLRCSSFRRAAGLSSAVEASSLATIPYHMPTVGGAIQRFLSNTDMRQLRGRGRARVAPYQNNLHWVRGSSQFAIAVHRRTRLMGGQDEAA